eukprot:TRINITY_DN1368_c0_g1_i2.p1 TRINITY_DN1368_c0_g1~~TRINITY_DN1368_c0_g1_i2.p1  ORF type:complete len:566 (+),score=148.33 TRINITY_DN1368_c0_g1_i2:138-1835(+)
MRRVLLLCVLLGILACAQSIAARKPVGHEEPTEEYAMELHPEANPFEIADKHGHHYIGRVGDLENMHIFRKKSFTVHGETHPHHDDNDHVLWSEQQVKRVREKRQMPNIVSPTDPLYTDQWHLKSDAHVNVQAAWALGLTGEGVNIAIVDDGIQYDHPDLQKNYRKEYSYDFNYWDDNPYPDAASDDHGTSAAGVAAAGMNQHCGVGPAHKAGLSAIRLISVGSADNQEGAALHYKGKHNHIYSNSWGPTDDGRRKEGPGRLGSLALEDGIKNGRDGLGSIYSWAGGNGRGSKDNCNYDGWANSRYTITVAAVDWYGKQTYYSESCSMLLVSAPSSGSGKYITTTDLTGSRGTSRSDCTSTFGGTSAAAPLAAGVMALVLQANPKIGWRDMQNILLETAKKTDPQDSEWIVNGAGKMYSHKYGFGVIDAGAACKMAMSNYTNLGPEINSTAMESPDMRLQSAGGITEFTLKIDENFIVEHTRVVVYIATPRRGDLSISLISPMKTRSVLAEFHNDQGSDYTGWDFGSIANWGESSAGTYTLIIVNNGGGVTSLKSWKLTVFGRAK